MAPAARTVIETKFIRDEAHGKGVTKEMNDDIQMYRRHPDCDHLIFFLYDPESLIPDVQALKAAYEVSWMIDGKALRCYVVVKP
jgi:hypothetical protein